MIQHCSLPPRHRPTETRSPADYILEPCLAKVCALNCPETFHDTGVFLWSRPLCLAAAEFISHCFLCTGIYDVTANISFVPRWRISQGSCPFGVNQTVHVDRLRLGSWGWVDAESGSERTLLRKQKKGGNSSWKKLKIPSTFPSKSLNSTVIKKKSQFGSLKSLKLNLNFIIPIKFCYSKPDLSSGLLSVATANLALISFLPTSASTRW